MKVVAIAGHFDPLHRGHLDHIREARKLGDFLIVLLNPDEDSERKRGDLPFLLPYEDRKEILLDNKYVGAVIKVIDGDGTCAKTLKKMKPDVFAKGGDRTPDNMPQNEVEVCQEIGCEIVYGVGKKLNSSTSILRDFIKRYLG